MMKHEEYKLIQKHGTKWLKNGTQKARPMVIDSKAPGNIILTSMTDSGGRLPDGRIIPTCKYADVNETELKTLLKDNKFLYETIHEYPYKIYFDVDGKGDKPDNYREKITNKINELFQDADIAVSGSETLLKKSYHIILNNYIVNNEEDKQKLKAVVKYLKLNFDDGFDDVVYKPFQLIKCINQHKHDKTVETTQKIISNSNIEKHIITAFINKDAKNINDIKFSDAIEEHINKQTTKATKQEHQPQTREEFIITKEATNGNNDNKQLGLKLLKTLRKERTDTEEEFFKIGCLIHNLKLGFDIWFELSKLSKYYQNGTRDWCLGKWVKIEKTNYKGLGIKTLYKWTREDNIDMFHKIMIEEKIIHKEVERNDIVKFESRYLLDLKKKLNDTDNILVSKTKELFSNKNYSSLNIKSPYDTGKTQYLKEVIRTYEQKRILWISYRKTLTYDIYGNFKEFGFVSYLDGKCDDDRLIIQIESLQRIKNKDNDEMEKYDLIIMDEVESILNQFNSSITFKHKQREVFNYLDEVIKETVLTGGKIITLDGDISERTYNFIGSYGNMINLKNEITFNDKIINVHNDRKIFNTKLYDALDANKKIIMPCMSEKEATHYEEKIKEKYPDLLVIIYTGKTDDSDKKKLKNIIEEWDKADVVIYTPTIEAGVSFDKERFDAIFGIISENVASQRSYFQMMARVRKIKDNNITLYNLNSCKINDCYLENFDDYKDGLIETQDTNLIMRVETRGDKRVKVYGDKFDDVYVFNKVEQANTGKASFMLVFKKIALKKGFKFNLFEKLEDAPKCEENPDPAAMLIKLLNTPLITQNEFDNLSWKQKHDGITGEQYFKIEKYMLKFNLKVDVLDAAIIDKFYKKAYVNNYASLLSLDNIKEMDINDEALTKRKTTIIKEFLKSVGFETLNSKAKITNTTLNKILLEQVKQKTPLFSYENKNRILFTSQNKNLSSTKGILGYVNSILKNYSLKISSTRERAGGKDKINLYTLETLHGIQDIMKFRNMSGINMNDDDNIILDDKGKIKDKNTPTWGHLINKEIIKNEDDEFIDTSHLDKNIEM